MDKPKKLLLIIDMQEGFRSKESKSILPKVMKLIKSFKEEIIFSKFVNEKKSLFESQLHWKKFQIKKEQKLLTEIENKNNLVFEHSNYTVLTKKLKKFIFKNRINRVYLCGVYTDVCILKTAMDMFDNNIEVFVIANACNSLHGLKNHKTALNSLSHIIGKHHILSTNEI